MNKTQLAKAYGISETSMRNWLSGKRTPRGKNAELWEALNRDWEWNQEREMWIKKKAKPQA
jgi:DNA-binding transcriptional regulator YiaG